MKVKQATTNQELEQALEVRKEVFVEEQDVPLELEIDGNDQQADQFIAVKQGEVIGTCRLRSDNQTGKVERMAVKVDFRRQRVGSKLLESVTMYAQQQKLATLVLHAQLKAREFYLQNGFQVISEEIIVEAGIEHVKMKLEL
ncbi:GNAT family N-acetyltransferase [Halanaerobaculum tunisiense]